MTVAGLVWASSDHETHDTPTQMDDAVTSFMTLGTTTQHAPGGKHEVETSTSECVPCRQQGTEPVSGRVPSRPPPHPVDENYERITGRGRDFQMPSEAAAVLKPSTPPRHGWVMMLTGSPIHQTNCFMKATDKQIELSRFSGALGHQQLTIDATRARRDDLDNETKCLVVGAQTLSRIAHAWPSAWVRNQRVEDWIVVSVGARSIYLTPVNSPWQSERQEDIQIRFSPEGSVIQLEFVRAKGPVNQSEASRVVWFPEHNAR